MEKFCVPYSGCKQSHITQYSSEKHKALDFWFNNCNGTFLVAPDVCEIEKIITDQTIDNDFYPAYKRGYGIVMRSLNNTKVQFLYWHCQQVFAVSVGQRVNQGDVVAQIGNSGYCVSGGVEVPLKNRGSKGSHLHLEIWIDGKQVDPFWHFDFDNQPKINKLKAIEQILIRFRNLLKNIK